MVKLSPLQAMKAHGGCGCKGAHIHSHVTRKRYGLSVRQVAIATVIFLLSREWCMDMAVYVTDLLRFAIATV